MVNCPLKLGQTRSWRNQYRAMRYAEKWYGYSWRAGVSVASCRRSTNVLVPYGRQRANVPAVSWTHGISAQLAGPLGGGSEQVASHDTGWAMCPVGFATTGGEYQELAWPMG